MISRTVKIQVAIFVLLSFFGVVYTGFKYVGIHSIGPVSFTPGPYTVRMYLTDSGGIFQTAQVTERGVPVGVVGSLHLAPAADPSGVEVDLKINHGVKIPADVTAQVADLSAVGEQYVELTPQSDSGPYLSGKAGTNVIPAANTAVPISDATLLENLNDLVNSVDRANLTIVIHELGDAFTNSGPDLQRLIDSGNALLASAQTALPQTLTLINDGKTVLNTQEAVSGDLKSFAHNLNLFSQQLVTSDSAFRAVLDNGVQSAQQLQTVLADNQAILPTLLGNLITLGQIQDVRLPQLQQFLILYPVSVANGFLGARVTEPDISNLAEAQFGAVLTQSPAACSTGYQSTKERSENPLNKTYGVGGNANLNAECSGTDQAGPGSSGTGDPRGTNNAVRPSGDNTGTRGGSIGTTTNADTPNYSVAGYNPATRAFNANGTTYTLGTDGAEAPLFGADAVQWLLVSAAEG